MLGVGVLGYGYWGPNLVRNFNGVDGSKVVAVCDKQSDRLAKLGHAYPAVEGSSDADAVISRADVDAVAIATPVSTHFDLAMRAMRAGKHVLVEKPLGTSTEEARRLIDEAERRNLTLMVDHTFVYTGAVQKIKEIVANGSVGEVYYYDSVRVNLGLFQPDVNVLYDLAVHDLAIMDFVLPEKPVAVSATGVANIPSEPANVAYLTLFFDSRFIAHMHVNWLAPVKVRRALIGGSEKMIIYDDLEPSEKVKIYDKGIVIGDDPEGLHKIRVSYRTGDMLAPRLDNTEALRTLALHFIDCVEHGKRPITDGQAGLSVVRVLEAALESMQKRGSSVEL